MFFYSINYKLLPIYGQEFFFLYQAMQIKGFFSNSSSLFQSGVLLYFILIGVLLNSATGYLIINTSELSSPFYTRLTLQFFSGILIFILPAICTAYFCSNKPAEFICIKRSVDIRILLLAIAMLLFISPVIGIASDLNAKIQVSELFPSIAEYMREADYRAARTTEMLLSERGIIPFITNILIIGVMAGITEEFLFRGALLSIIRKKVKNPHAAIWIVAIIFSIIHFQFSGFIPRALLGAFFGYLILWTRNIWVPVFIHFLNNATFIIAYKTGLYQLSPDSAVLNAQYTINNTQLTAHARAFIIITIVIISIALFALCVKKMKKIARGS